MGTNISKQSNESITNIVSKSIGEVQVDVDNNTTSTSYSHQNINIRLKNLTSDNITVAQISDVTTKALLNADISVISELAAKLSTEVKDSLSATLSQTNEDLNIGQTNIGIVEQTIEKNITNEITQMIKTGVKNTATVTTTNGQIMYLEVIDSNIKNITISQESIIKSMSENIAKVIAESTASAISKTEASSDMKSKVEQINKGLDPFAFLTMIGMGILCIGGVIIFIRSGQAMTMAKSEQQSNSRDREQRSNRRDREQRSNSRDREQRSNRRDREQRSKRGGDVLDYGPFNSQRGNLVLGIIVCLIILIGVQYLIHTKFEDLATSPITGDMVDANDKPLTIFSIF
jgi:hypothetical protein